MSLRFMPHLSWNEVRDRAIKFSRCWQEADSECWEQQTVWNEIFDVFGIRRAQDTGLREAASATPGENL